MGFSEKVNHIRNKSHQSPHLPVVKKELVSRFNVAFGKNANPVISINHHHWNTRDVTSNTRDVTSNTRDVTSNAETWRQTQNVTSSTRHVTSNTRDVKYTRRDVKHRICDVTHTRRQTYENRCYVKHQKSNTRCDVQHTRVSSHTKSPVFSECLLNFVLVRWMLLWRYILLYTRTVCLGTMPKLTDPWLVTRCNQTRQPTFIAIIVQKGMEFSYLLRSSWDWWSGLQTSFCFLFWWHRQRSLQTKRSKASEVCRQ